MLAMQSRHEDVCLVAHVRSRGEQLAPSRLRQKLGISSLFQRHWDIVRFYILDLEHQAVTIGNRYEIRRNAEIVTATERELERSEFNSPSWCISASKNLF